MHSIHLMYWALLMKLSVQLQKRNGYERNWEEGGPYKSEGKCGIKSEVCNKKI